MDDPRRSLDLPKLALGALVLYYIARTVYRLFFHPLARVPGPRIAAISSLYEFYWDCVKFGRYHVKIDEMHEKYGPIVRINPWEVHIDDPAFVSTLYNNSKLEKDPFFYGAFGINTSSFSTVDVPTYRMRREPINPFFSTANVHKLQSRILARVRQLCDRLEEFAAEDRPATVSNAYRCLAADVVTDFAMPETKALLAHPEFAPKWVRSIRSLSTTIIWNRHLKILAPLLQGIPRPIVAALDRDGGVTGVVDMNLDVFSQAKMITQGLNPKHHPTVLNSIFTSPNLPPYERTFHRLANEALAFLAAGSETTGSTLSVLTYHALANPPILQRLRVDLAAAAKAHGISRSELIDLEVAESIPYLQALMKEALRYATPITGRLPRRSKDTPISYTPPSSSITYTIPPLYPVSMTPRTLHYSPTLFPSPHTFNPDRWLTSDTQQLTQMNRFFMPFGKGARICVGMELAKAEVLLVAANLFWRFDLELYGTGEEEVGFVHDFFGAWEREGGKGVRVKVRREGA